MTGHTKKPDSSIDTGLKTVNALTGVNSFLVGEILVNAEREVREDSMESDDVADTCMPCPTAHQTKVSAKASMGRAKVAAHDSFMHAWGNKQRYTCSSAWHVHVWGFCCCARNRRAACMCCVRGSRR